LFSITESVLLEKTGLLSFAAWGPIIAGGFPEIPG
jgi:hypothetical protein